MRKMEQNSDLPSRRELRKAYLHNLLQNWVTWVLIVTFLLLINLIVMSIIFVDFVFTLVGISANMLALLIFFIGTHDTRMKHKEIIKFKRRPWMGIIGNQKDKRWVQKFRYSI